MKSLKDAEDALRKFIEENPRAAAYQREIDAVLSKTPIDKRLEVITVMMCCKFAEIQTNLTALTAMKEEC